LNHNTGRLSALQQVGGGFAAMAFRIYASGATAVRLVSSRECQQPPLAFSGEAQTCKNVLMGQLREIGN
jgi:hypothetical protein